MVACLPGGSLRRTPHATRRVGGTGARRARTGSPCEVRSLLVRPAGPVPTGDRPRGQLSSGTGPAAPSDGSAQLPDVCSGLISAWIVLFAGSKPSWLNTTVYAP